MVAERRKRISSPKIRRFVELLEGLTIHEDSLPVGVSMSNFLPLAQNYGLSAYNTSYLEVAIRGAAPATLDSGLEKAAGRRGWK